MIWFILIAQILNLETRLPNFPMSLQWREGARSYNFIKVQAFGLHISIIATAIAYSTLSYSCHNLYWWVLMCPTRTYLLNFFELLCEHFSNLGLHNILLFLFTFLPTNPITIVHWNKWESTIFTSKITCLKRFYPIG